MNELRPFQRVALDHAVEFFANADRNSKMFYAAPTGCGKSYIERELLTRVPGSWIVSPREEILDGLIAKGAEPDRVCTPVKLRNRLLRGDCEPPKALILDEGHHDNAETWRQLDLLTGLAPAAAYSATPYRGTPRSTRDLLERFGEPVWLITFEEAIAEGYISKPTFSVLPLIDDDIVTVTASGEFDVESLESTTMGRLDDLAEQSTQWWKEGRWDRATVYALPSRQCCLLLREALKQRGVEALIVSADTPRDDRRLAFALVTDRRAALLQINIVSEGVDLPLRRLVDAAATMSPVRWVQQLGRITRPTDVPPEYVGCTRNLARHAYALEGAVPVQAVVAVEQAFGPTERAHSRALGLEAIGRFRPAQVKLLNGATAYVYSLSAVAGDGVVAQYCCIVPPASNPLWAVKVNLIKNGVKTWGDWSRCEAPTDLKGFASAPDKAPSEKQLAWWRRSAARVGLEPSEDPNKRNFAALPVLFNTGGRL